MAIDIERLLNQSPSDIQLSDYPQIIIYGAGKIGKKISQVLHSRSIRISGFLDQNAFANVYWEGIPIFHPTKDINKITNKSKTAVIVAIHNHRDYIAPVIKRLSEYHFGKIITMVDLFDQFSNDLGDQYWLAPRGKYKDWKKDIEYAETIWEDDVSRNIFEQQLRLRITADYASVTVTKPQEQYLPEDVPPWKDPIRLVDCGAYTGDTLRAFIRSKYTLQCAAIFEPDQENFKTLIQGTSDPSSIEIFYWPCAVYSNACQIEFSGGHGASSRLAKGSEGTIQAVALDDVIPGFKPTLIKMDIEGAEIEGLLGARRIINTYKPGLALCAYHKPEHLWQIPLLLKQWDLGYKFYLRNHGYNGFDLVIYAVPE